MLRVIAPVSALLFAVALMTLGYGLLGTVLAVRMAAESFSTLVAGLVMAAYFLGLVIGSLSVGRLVRAVGHIRTFAALASAFSAATLAHVFEVAPLPWAALRVVEGFCMAGLFLCVESWLNDRATNQTRGAMLAAYLIVNYLFAALAQFLLVVAPVEGFTLFALTSILMSLALLPVAMTRAPAPPIPQHRPFGLRRLVAISPLGVAGCVASGLASGAFYALGPRYGAAAGLAPLGVATLMAAGIAGGLLLQWPVGRLSDRLDRRKVIAGVAAALALCGVALTLTDLLTGPATGMASGLAEDPLRIALIAAWGGAMFLLYPLALAHANDFIDPADFVGASGGLILSYSIGATIGPVAAAALMEATAPWGLFAFQAGVGVVLFAFTGWRLRIGRAVPDESRAPFQPTPRTAYALIELDPRAAGGDREEEAAQ